MSLKEMQEWHEAVLSCVEDMRHALDGGLTNEPLVKEEEVDSYIWLSAEEKKKVLANYHAAGVKKDYLNDVKRRGNFLHLRYTMPEEPLGFSSDFGIVTDDLNGELLIPCEWQTPVDQVIPTYSESEDSDSDSDIAPFKSSREKFGPPKRSGYDSDDYTVRDDYADRDKKSKPFEGIIELDETTKEQIEDLGDEAIALFLRRLKRYDPELPSHDVTWARAEERGVNCLLRLAGYENPDELSKCVRAGLIRGHFGFIFIGDERQLDQVVLEGRCSDFHCNAKCPGIFQATIRKLLEQPDYAGLDYWNDSTGASIKCGICGKGQYVSRCCTGKLDWTNGRSHNHCKKCEGLGMCIDDYREAHCKRCSGHYYRGFCTNFPCDCKPLFQMISEAKKGHRAALAALYFYKETGIGYEYQDYFSQDYFKISVEYDDSDNYDESDDEEEEEETEGDTEEEEDDEESACDTDAEPASKENEP